MENVKEVDLRRNQIMEACCELSGNRKDFDEAKEESDALEVLEVLNNRRSRQARRAHREVDGDDMNVVDMDLSRPSSSVVTSHRPRNGYPVQEEFVMSDDDEPYPIHDPDDLECSERNSITRNNLPLIPTECGSVTEALHNFVVVFESRGISERRPLALYIHHDGSIAANIFPSKVLCSDAVSNLLRCQYILWPWDITHKENEVKLREWLEMVGMSEMRRTLESMVYDKEKFPLLIIITKDHGSYNINDICSGMDSADIVMEKLMAGIDTYSTIRNTEKAEEAARLERERIRQEQAHERQLLASQLPDEPAEGERGAIMVKFRLPGSEQCDTSLLYSVLFLYPVLRCIHTTLAWVRQYGYAATAALYVLSSNFCRCSDYYLRIIFL
ncbi:hypothetical protein TELCIR_02066 [Teladorsagia circumcincta]|uniref:UAS domain-containing protein n=1 Tax=Teladorsagia circumcincta TaxID=45464 RepID=A0A2G9V059_TELCI|nr:hypothetical protein TELCIR_02066 [Teladorsagia circumcincta]